MKSSMRNWSSTFFAKLGFRKLKPGETGTRSLLVSRRNRKRKQADVNCQYEILGPRQMLAFNVTSFGLVNDTGASNIDLITSDPTVSGTLTADGPTMTTGSIEFDHYGDGGVDGTITPQVGVAFNYDPQSTDVSVSSHTGPFDLNYRVIEKDMFDQVVSTGNWQTLSLDLQADSASDIQVTDELLATIANGVSVFDFGSTGVGETIDKSFTIHNWGNENLLLDQSSLTLPTGFSVVTQFAASIPPTQSSTLTVRFDAAAIGNLNGTLSFTTNDPDTATFSFTVTGDVIGDAPDIEMRGPTGTAIVNTTGQVDAGTAGLAGPSALSIAIYNHGTADLNLDLTSIAVTGDFTLLTNPAAVVGPAGGVTYVVLEMDSSILGPKMGSFSIQSDDTDDPTFSFGLIGNVNNGVAIDFFNLVDDTGASSTDKSSYDPRVNGAVNGDLLGGFAHVQFDHDGNGTVDGFQLIETSGQWFEYDPREFESQYADQIGAQTLSYRYILFDDLGFQQQVGNWSQFSFTLEDDPTLGDLAVKYFGLTFDNVVTGDPLASTTPAVSGVLDGAIGSGSAKIEFDHDGDGTVDGSVQLTESPGAFEYDPSVTDPGFGVGPHTIRYRISKFDATDTLVDSGSWVQFSFTLVAPSAASATIDNVSLVLDDGTDGTDNITTDGRVLVDVTPGNNEGFIVELDNNADGVAEESMFVPSGTQLEIPADSFAYGSNAMDLRIKQWSSEQKAYTYTSWTSFNFTLNPADAPGLKNVALAYDTGTDNQDTVSTDPTFKGSIDQSHRDYPNFEVELDLDGDGTPDQSVQVDSDGNFEIKPEGLSPGINNLAFRTALFDPKLNGTVHSVWESFTVNLEQAAVPTLGTLELLNDDGVDATDGITSDARLKGVVSGTAEERSGVTVELDYDADGVADATATTDYYGRFIVDAPYYTNGTFTVNARTSTYDEYAADTIYDSWVPKTFELALLANSGPTVGGLHLKFDTGTSDSDNITYNPAIGGSLSPFSPMSGQDTSYQRIEYDFNGDGIADGETETGGDGSFIFSPTGLTIGQQTASVRGSAWDYDGEQYVFGDWVSFSFEMEAKNIVAAEVTTFELLSDTLTDGDNLTANMSVTGNVTNASVLGGVYLEFNEDSDRSTIEGFAFANSDLDFYYTPGPYAFGSATIEARAVGWDHDGEQYLYGAWVTLTATYQNQTNLAPQIRELALTNDNGISDVDHVTSDTNIKGRVSNEFELAGITIDVDLDSDGTPEFETTTDRFGRFNYELELDPGVYSVQVRPREIDYLTGGLLTGAWSSLAITVDAGDSAQDGVDVMSLHNAVPGSTDTSSKPIISGTVTQTGTSVNQSMQFDHNGDGTVDGVEEISNEGSFSYEPLNVAEGQHTFYARVKQYDFQANVSYSNWESITFTVVGETDDSVQVSGFALTNDTGNSAIDRATADATVSGAVVNAANLQGLIVEIDTNNDGLADADVLTDATGAFIYDASELANGSHYFAARALTTNEYGMLEATDWAELSFVLDDEPDGTDAQAAVVALDQFQASIAGSGNTSKLNLYNIRQQFENVLGAIRETLDSTVAEINAVRNTDVDTARDLYWTQREGAYQTYLGELNTALQQYQSSLNGEEYFNLVGYELPTEFSTNRAKLDDAKDRPLPPADLPDFKGEVHDFEKDSTYKDAIKTAQKNFKLGFDSAGATLDNGLKAELDAYNALIKTAYNEYRSGASAAGQVYIDAIESLVASPQHVTLKNSIGSLSSEIEKQKRLKKKMESNAWEIHNANMGQISSEFPFNMDPLVPHSAEEVILRAAELRRHEEALAKIEEDFDKAIFGLHKQIEDANDNIRNYLGNGKLAAHLVHEHAISDLKAIRDKAIATAAKNRSVNEAGFWEAFKKTVSGLKAALYVATADAVLDAFEKRKTANPNSKWWNYQYDLAKETRDYVSAQSNLRHLSNEKVYAEAKLNVGKVANAFKGRQDSVIDAIKEKEKGEASTLNTFQVKEIDSFHAQQLRNNTHWNQYKEDFAAAEREYLNDLAVATETYGVENGLWAIANFIVGSTEVNHDITADFAINKINAKHAFGDSLTGAKFGIGKYHEKYYASEQTYADEVSQWHSDREIANAKIDHGEAAVVGFIKKVAKANRDFLDAFATENATMWGKLAIEESTYADGEAGLYQTMTKNKSSEWEQFQIDVVAEYVSNIMLWDTVINTPWSAFVYDVAVDFEDFVQDKSSNLRERDHKIADGIAAAEIRGHGYLKSFMTDQASDRADFVTESSIAILKAVDRDDPLSLSMREDISTTVLTFEKGVTKAHFDHQEVVRIKTGELEGAIDEAHWELQSTLVNLGRQLEKGEITLAAHDAQKATAENLEKTKHADAELDWTTVVAASSRDSRKAIAGAEANTGKAKLANDIKTITDNWISQYSASQRQLHADSTNTGLLEIGLNLASDLATNQWQLATDTIASDNTFWKKAKNDIFELAEQAANMEDELFEDADESFDSLWSTLFAEHNTAVGAAIGTGGTIPQLAQNSDSQVKEASVNSVKASRSARHAQDRTNRITHTANSILTGSTNSNAVFDAAAVHLDGDETAAKGIRLAFLTAFENYLRAQRDNEIDVWVDRGKANTKLDVEIAEVERAYYSGRADHYYAFVVAVASANSNKHKGVITEVQRLVIKDQQSQILQTSIATDDLTRLAGRASAVATQVAAHGMTITASASRTSNAESASTSEMNTADTNYTNALNTNNTTNSAATVAAGLSNIVSMIGDAILELTDNWNSQTIESNANKQSDAVQQGSYAQIVTDTHQQIEQLKATRFVAHAASTGTTADQFYAQKQQGFANWLEDLKDDSYNYGFASSESKSELTHDIASAFFGKKIDVLNAELTWQVNSVTVNTDLPTSIEVAHADKESDLTTALNLHETQSTDADNDRLGAYASAAATKANELVAANEAHRLRLVAGVGEATSSQLQKEERAAAEKKESDARATANKNWRVAISLANKTLLTDKAGDAHDENVAINAAIKNFLDSIVVHDDLLEDSIQVGVSTQDLAVSTATGNSSIASANASYALHAAMAGGMVAATATMVTDTASAPWAVFAHSISEAKQSWWTGLKIEFDQKHADDVTALTQMQTDRNAAELVRHEAKQAAKQAAESSERLAFQTQNDNDSLALRDYFIAYASHAHDWIVANAGGANTYENAQALAIEKLANGTFNGQSYGQSEYDADLLTAEINQTTTAKSTQLVYSIADAWAHVTESNSMAANSESYVNTVAPAIYIRILAEASADRVFYDALADQRQAFSDALASNQSVYDSAAATELTTAVTAEFLGLTDPRSVLAVAMTSSEGTRELSNAPARNTFENTKSLADKNASKSNSAALEQAKIASASNARDTLNATAAEVTARIGLDGQALNDLATAGQYNPIEPRLPGLESAQALAIERLANGTYNGQSYGQSEYDADMLAAESAQLISSGSTGTTFANADAAAHVIEANTIALGSQTYVNTVGAAFYTSRFSSAVADRIYYDAVADHHQVQENAYSLNRKVYDSASAAELESSVNAEFASKTDPRSVLEIGITSAFENQENANAVSREVFENTKSQADVDANKAKSVAFEQAKKDSAANSRDTLDATAAEVVSNTNAAGEALNSLAASGQYRPQEPKLPNPGDTYLPRIDQTKNIEYFKSMPGVEELNDEMFKRVPFDADAQSTLDHSDYDAEEYTDEKLRDGLIHNRRPERAIDPYRLEADTLPKSSLVGDEDVLEIEVAIGSSADSPDSLLPIAGAGNENIATPTPNPLLEDILAAVEETGIFNSEEVELKVGTLTEKEVELLGKESVRRFSIRRDFGRSVSGQIQWLVGNNPVTAYFWGTENPYSMESPVPVVFDGEPVPTGWSIGNFIIVILPDSTGTPKKFVYKEVEIKGEFLYQFEGGTISKSVHKQSITGYKFVGIYSANTSDESISKDIQKKWIDGRIKFQKQVARFAIEMVPGFNAVDSFIKGDFDAAAQWLALDIAFAGAGPLAGIAGKGIAGIARPVIKGVGKASSKAIENVSKLYKFRNAERIKRLTSEASKIEFLDDAAENLIKRRPELTKAQALAKIEDALRVPKKTLASVSNESSRETAKWGVNWFRTARIRQIMSRSAEGRAVLKAADDGLIDLVFNARRTPVKLWGQALPGIPGDAPMAIVYLQNIQNGQVFKLLNRRVSGYDLAAAVGTHEGLHALGVGGSRRAEALVRLAELKMHGIPIDRTSIRQVLTNMGSFYDHLPWRIRLSNVQFKVTF